MNTLVKRLEILTGKSITIKVHEKGTEYELKAGQYVSIIKETKTKIIISTRNSGKDLTVFYLRAFAKLLKTKSADLKEQLDAITDKQVKTHKAPKAKTPKKLIADSAKKYYNWSERQAYKVPHDEKSGKKIHHWSHVVKTFRGKLNQLEEVNSKMVKNVLKDLFGKYECDHDLVSTKCWAYVERKYGISK